VNANRSARQRVLCRRKSIAPAKSSGARASSIVVATKPSVSEKSNAKV
jgi:hypothetical protein